MFQHMPAWTCACCKYPLFQSRDVLKLRIPAQVRAYLAQEYLQANLTITKAKPLTDFILSQDVTCLAGVVNIEAVLSKALLK